MGRCAEKLATEKWQIGKLEPLRSIFGEVLVLDFSKVVKWLQFLDFLLLPDGQLLCTALYPPLALVDRFIPAVFFLFFFITLEPRVEWYKRL